MQTQDLEKDFSEERIFPTLICPGKSGFVDLIIDVKSPAAAVIEETPMLKLEREPHQQKVLAKPTSAPFAYKNW